MSRSRLLIALAAALLLVPAAPAAAATVNAVGGGLEIRAGAGERNTLTVTHAAGTFTVVETGAFVPLYAGFGCSAPAPGRVTCSSAGLTRVTIEAGDGADTVTTSADFAATIDDGPGNDRVTGGPRNDLFIGSAGDDTLIGAGGDDSFGDAGGPGADTLDGAAGADTADYSGRNEPLALTIDDVRGDGQSGEGDDVRTTVEHVRGGSGGDRLVGSDAANVLRGNGGDDSFDGRGGADRFEGGNGRDVVDYRSRGASINVSLDNIANDGGEGDDARSDLEDVRSGSGNDTLTGSVADNALDGGAGNDLVRGSTGNDTLTGGDGTDALEGFDGDDRLAAGTGEDLLYGGDGDDDLSGGSGADLLDGGDGSDAADYRERTDALVVDTATGQGAGGDDLREVEGVFGGSGNDRLEGGDGDGRFDGGAGDDTLDGGWGSDSLAGGPGRDEVTYASRGGGVTVYLDDNDNDGARGEGDDVRRDVEQLVGSSQGDRLVGDDDAETLVGGGGDDALTAKGGDDVIEGSNGNDTVDAGSGNDRVGGGSGNDRLAGGDGDDAVEGASGNDTVDGNSGGDRLAGGDGEDRISGGSGNDELDGGASGDRLDGGDGEDRIDGSSGDDTADGGTANDRVDGASGNDRLNGSGGDDLIGGGDGNDTVSGGDGGDVLNGDGGNDSLQGSSGDDTLDGGAGNDSAGGGSGGDAVNGASGADRLNGDAGDDRVDGGDEDDRVEGSDGNDSVQGSGGDDALGGGSGDDQLAGGPDADRLSGEAGADRLLGDDGDDDLQAGNDDDVLIGGAGGDKLDGGNGEDTVDYAGRIGAVRVTNDGKADDGERNERDDVRDSVDHVIGGAGNDVLRLKNAWGHRLYGEGGNDVLEGGSKADTLVGGPGKDQLVGRAGRDTFDGGAGNDRLSAADTNKEQLRCGAGKDVAVRDRLDKAISCETLKRGNPSGADLGPVGPSEGDTAPVAPSPGRQTGTKRVYGGGRFVGIPGSPGERIDRRLLKDIAYLKAKYKIAITDGFALQGHAHDGEHPVGLALDIIPGPGGSWSDVDRLAKWAEPKQNRPRAPFRWVGYNGDSGHGRGHHLHLSWQHARTGRGKPAKWVVTFAFKSNRAVTTFSARKLAPLASRSNFRLGGKPTVRSGLTALPRCRGPQQLAQTWKTAARAFGLRASVLAAITEIESGHGCNMGPSSAGAIGWTQFMPATWKMWGMDADGDGKASPYNSVDAIFSTARYLRASGAPRSYRKALFAYNHATWYVNKVLARSKAYR
jgi:Ca2+-binding RTX toxin-like protein